MDLAYQLAIDMAAHGMVSGRLREWPILMQALYLTHSIHGQPISEGTTAREAKKMAKSVLKYWLANGTYAT